MSEGQICTLCHNSLSAYIPLILRKSILIPVFQVELQGNLQGAEVEAAVGEEEAPWTCGRS